MCVKESNTILKLFLIELMTERRRIFDFQSKFWYIQVYFTEVSGIPTIMQCEFCKIIRGESKAEVLYANEHAIAILDIKPIHYGHALIIPKTHCDTFVEVPEEELHDLILATRVVSSAIVKALKPPGFNIFSNNGKAAGQSVFHFHFHITPRYQDDNIQFVLNLKEYADTEMTAYADQIRTHISNLIVHQTM
jgi:histidine triad (HIT) family protein